MTIIKKPIHSRLCKKHGIKKLSFLENSLDEIHCGQFKFRKADDDCTITGPIFFLN